MYKRLEARYGRKGAIAILTLSVATLPIPFNVTAIVGGAELVKKLTGNEAEAELPDEEVYRLAVVIGGELRAALAEARKLPGDVNNAFCPTGAGGGIDPTCPSKKGTTSSGEARSPKVAVVGMDWNGKHGGLYSDFTTNTRWRFNTDAEKLKAFRAWLKRQVKSRITRDEDELWRRFAEEGMKKGAARAFDDVRRSERALSAGDDKKLDFYRGTRREFLRDSFRRPEAVSKIKLLASRSFNELEGVTDDMSRRMSRALTVGLVQGQHPLEIAQSIAEEADVSLQRAELIARTEIIRAHAEGQLDAFEELGVEEVGVAVEWQTAEDEAVCALCEPMEGVVLQIDEARDMIPRHPNCRCAWVPANVGEDGDGQKDSKRSIESAVRASQRRAGDEEGEGWGPGREIARERPRSVVNAALLRFERAAKNGAT